MNKEEKEEAVSNSMSNIERKMTINPNYNPYEDLMEHANVMKAWIDTLGFDDE